MKKKKIGIPAWSVGDNSFGVTKSYLNFFQNFGEVVLLAPSRDINKELDLVVLPGGKDISSMEYGEVPNFANSDADLFKEFFYKNNLKKYIDNGTPIFAICLGIQQLNVFFGGTLTQHMYHEYSNPRTELTHEVKRPLVNRADGTYFVSKITDTLTVINTDKFKVNSMHHQAIRWNQMAKDLEIVYLDEDGEYVEALKHKTLAIAGTQWHPEEIFDEYSISTVSELLSTKKA